MGQEVSHELVDDKIPPHTLKSRTVEGVADLISEGRAPRIVVLTGAGISTSAGIPDFRSPDTGLYANLARLNLPYAEAVFDISYFRHNPRPFYALARELYPGKYFPTVAHCFISLLARKGLLHMLFTQNIDCLERAAGIPEEKIIEAHGSFATHRCIECGGPYPGDLMKEKIEAGEVPQCQVSRCNGLVKPDIVFFGEALPASFNANMHKVAMADLLIIMGTSLSVHPFANLPEIARERVPRVLLNLGRVGGIGSRLDDVYIAGDCDAGVRKLADALEWREELETLWKEMNGKEDEELAQEPKTKDEILEEEISKLTAEVDHSLKVSQSHRDWVESSLEKETSTSGKNKGREEDSTNVSPSKPEHTLNNSCEGNPRAQNTEKVAPEVLVIPAAAPPKLEIPSASQSGIVPALTETSGPNIKYG